MTDDDDLDRLLANTAPAKPSEAELAALAARIVHTATQQHQQPARPIYRPANDRYWLAGVMACAASIMIGFVIGQGQLSLGADDDVAQDFALIGALSDNSDLLTEDML